MWAGATARGCRRISFLATTLLLALTCCVGSSAYSVLTHEEIVDL